MKGGFCFLEMLFMLPGALLPPVLVRTMFDPCFEFGRDGLHQTLKASSQDLLGRYGKGEGGPNVVRTWP